MNLTLNETRTDPFMKLFISQVLLCMVCVVLAMEENLCMADNFVYFAITTNQAAFIEQRLAAYEKGQIHLADLTENAGQEGCRELIGYYYLHSNDIPVKAKIPISRTFAAGEMYPQAIKLAKEYVNVYSNDWLGWSILGYCYSAINYTNETFMSYSNAIRLGDKDSYEVFAGNAFKYGRIDLIKEIIPELMALKNSKDTLTENKQHLISLLLLYSAKTDRKDIFLQTLQGENLKEILKNDAVKKDIISGCGYFADEDTDGEIKKIRLSLEAALKSDSDSKTNSINGVSP